MLVAFRTYLIFALLTLFVTLYIPFVNNLPVPAVSSYETYLIYAQWHVDHRKAITIINALIPIVRTLQCLCAITSSIAGFLCLWQLQHAGPQL